MAPANTPQPLAELDPIRDEPGLWYICSRLRMYLELHGEITVDNWNATVSAARELAQERDPRHAHGKAKHGYASVKK
jgi:hypothetical protein